MPNKELIDTLAKYIIALATLAACFGLIATSRGEEIQSWTVIGLIVGWLIRDSAGNSASANTAKIAAASAPIVLTQEQATGQPTLGIQQ